MLTTPEELLQILTGGAAKEAGKERNEGPSDPILKQLYQALDWEAKSLEEICQRTGMKAEDAAGSIPLLLLSGWAKETSFGYYEKAR